MIKDSNNHEAITVTECIVFLSTYGAFLRLDHMLGHKTSLSKLKESKPYQISFQLQWYKTGYPEQEEN